ncbi:hypothetical protein BKA56DRAFT_150170 [Ilyonectria sp. MPI-CAGE-AT-0026]|nr:hypothetical protein BKA56DRAFT_150170 [Ilyonectria sp. MPI-CAGE-AT-0026]
MAHPIIKLEPGRQSMAFCWCCWCCWRRWRRSAHLPVRRPPRRTGQSTPPGSPLAPPHLPSPHASLKAPSPLLPCWVHARYLGVRGPEPHSHATRTRTPLDRRPWIQGVLGPQSERDTTRRPRRTQRPSRPDRWSWCKPASLRAARPVRPVNRGPACCLSLWLTWSLWSVPPLFQTPPPPSVMLAAPRVGAVRRSPHCLLLDRRFALLSSCHRPFQSWV